MKRKWVIVSCAPAMVAATFVSACSDDDNTPLNRRDGGIDSSADSSKPDTGADTGAPDAGVETLTFTKVTSFDVTSRQLPYGLVVQGGTPIVGIAPQGKLLKVPADGGLTELAAFSSVSYTLTLGLAQDPTNAVYIAVGRYGPTTEPAPGIYKVSAEGGAPAPYNSSGESLANGVIKALDLVGTDLLVSDPSGRILKVDAAGNVTVWKADDSFNVDPGTCTLPDPFSVSGITGLTHDDNFIYAVVHSKGAFVRVKRETNGSAGAVEVLYRNCDFAGAEGIVRDTDGTFLVANDEKNRIDRVTVNGASATFKTIASGAPLDGPASLFIEGTAPNKKLWVVSSAFQTAGVTDGGPAPGVSASPALLSAPLK